MTETCVLDVARHGGVALEVVSELLGLTRESVRRIEAEALQKIRRGFARRGVTGLR